MRALIDKNLAMYGQLPSYRAMFDREGVAGPGELAIVGDENIVGKQIEALRAAGVTEFAASEFAPNADERLHTRTLLKAMARG